MERCGNWRTKTLVITAATVFGGCSAKEKISLSSQPGPEMPRPRDLPPDLGGSPAFSFQEIAVAGVENLQSDFSVDAPIDFLVRLPAESKVPDQDVEAAVSVFARAGNALVDGSLTWGIDQRVPAARRLRFSPTNPLPLGDYVIRVEPVGSFRADRFGDGASVGPGSHRLLFAVGSRLRLKWFRLVSKDGGATALYAVWRFTEAADTQSVRAGVAFSAAALPVPGRLHSADVKELQEFTFTFDKAIALNSWVTMTMAKTVIAPGGRRLDPRTFDSNTTNQHGDLEVTLAKGASASCGQDCFQWSPEVKW